MVIILYKYGNSVFFRDPTVLPQSLRKCHSYFLTSQVILNLIKYIEKWYLVLGVVLRVHVIYTV